MTQQLRNFYLLIFVFALCGRFAPAYGQDTLLFVDFEDQQIPATWTNLDLDSLTDASGNPADWFITSDAISSTASDTNYVCASSSWFNPAGTADNWLITNSLTIIDSNTYLIWKSAPFEGPVYMDGYEVLLSTGGTSTDSFTVNLKTFAEGINATAQATAGTVHTAYDGNRGILTEWRIPLGQWTGQTINLAFRHTSTDDHLIQIDDIFVGRVARFDASMNSLSYSTEYPIVPVSQTQPMFFTVNVSNQGAETLNYIQYDMTVYLGINPVANASDTVANMVPFEDQDRTYTNGYLPTVSGSYRISVKTLIDSTDAHPENDTMSLGFVVDDSVYARESGDISGFTDLSGNAGFMGQVFNVPVSDILTSVSLYVRCGASGDTIRGAVYNFGTQPGVIKVMTDPFVTTAGFEGWINLSLEGIDLPMGAGKYLVGIELQSGNSVEIATSDFKHTMNKSWRRLQSTWATDDALDNEFVYLARPCFGIADEFVGTHAWTDVSKSLIVYPNPATDRVNIRLEEALKTKGVLRIMDLEGRILMNEYLNAGMNQIQIGFNPEIVSGTYFIDLKTENESYSGSFRVIR